MHSKFSIVVDSSTDISKQQLFGTSVVYWKDKIGPFYELLSLDDCEGDETALGLYKIIQKVILDKPYAHMHNKRFDEIKESYETVASE